MNINYRGRAIVVVAGLFLTSSIAAQQRTTPAFGLHENTPRVHAFTGANVIVAPGVAIEGGTVIIRDGIIEAVGEAPAIPADARVWALEGRNIYAGFIDPMTEVGLPDGMASPSSGRGGGGGATQGAAPGQANGDGARYWNSHVRRRMTSPQHSYWGTTRRRNCGNWDSRRRSPCRAAASFAVRARC